MENEVLVHKVNEHEVKKAVKLSCIQAMLGSIYAASTGGMFLVGYALRLGADNIMIGLLTTVPLSAVIFQLVAAFMVEKGWSRKKITFISQTLNVLCWFSIALTPWIFPGASQSFRLMFLIVAIGIITAVGHLANNARGSWIGDLIPAAERGTFFGRMMMFGGIIGTVFALAEGLFLDTVKRAGIASFSWLFLFGIAFGLVNAVLFLPQADIPIEKQEEGTGFMLMFREAMHNKALLIVSAFAVVFSLQAIAGPFYPTYMLRDLKMPFIGVGIVNACVSLVMLASSPFWGRMIDRFGCRPILVVCSFMMAPSCLTWLFVNSAATCYAIIIPINLFQGFWVAGIAVGLSTLIYKVTPVKGRSVQLAIHSVIVILLAAPMPTLGGYLPELLSNVGFTTDLRITFVLVGIFQLASAFVAMRIPESGAGTSKQVLKEVGARALSLLPRKM